MCGYSWDDQLANLVQQALDLSTKIQDSAHATAQAEQESVRRLSEVLTQIGD
jgi:hypothetical protein